MLFDRFETPAELFTHKLGAALKMERTVLKMLGKLDEDARSDDLRELVRHHAQETEHQLANVRRAFAALGVEPDDKPCPVIEAIDKEGRAQAKRADEVLVDSVIVAGAAEAEHHEIAVYEWLVTEADALGHDTVAGLLRENLQQEQHTLEEIKRLTRSLAPRPAARTP
jgi:ferritin-like metal-binding protein YciE